jgi:AcrR family transcriptional regulator
VANLTRKQREIVAREELLLSVGRELVQKEGPRELTMDKVAAASEYSKGTVYHHFSSKEDLLAALACQTMEGRIRMFERASAFAGTSRERLTAIGIAEELFVLSNEADFRLQMSIMQEYLRPAVKPERLNQIEMLEMRCMGITTGIVRDAIAQQDLVLPPNTSAEGLTMLLWGAYTGTFNMLTCNRMLDCPVLDTLPSDLDPVANLRVNIQLLLDGYGWAPLSSDWDYQTSRKMILAEIFPEYT